MSEEKGGGDVRRGKGDIRRETNSVSQEGERRPRCQSQRAAVKRRRESGRTPTKCSSPASSCLLSSQPSIPSQEPSRTQVRQLNWGKVMCRSRKVRLGSVGVGSGTERTGNWEGRSWVERRKKIGPGQCQVLEVTNYLPLFTLWFPALSPTEEPEYLGKEKEAWVSSDLKRPYGWLDPAFPL
ncbi:Hypothetical predicted protein [Marmota monax]|uniref:Uncharacterized protein n=1 Tax=Marmota monax TaxID=9995 RepID=A0A5E4ADS8_MARMO|nr:hypothetical protein GHT09_002790 [Marmota monax]VTJ55503.1 Hypothetical predicted protein [Marmota monax]